MNDSWAARTAAYLRRRGLADATLTPEGRITGLPGVRAVAVDLVDIEYVEHADMELLMSAAGGTMPYAVFQPRPGFPASAGYVTLALGGFARLLGAPDAGNATPRELAAVLGAAVAAATNYDVGMAMSVRDLIAGVDPIGVVAALAALYCEVLHALVPDGEARATLMQHLGLMAALGEVT